MVFGVICDMDHSILLHSALEIDDNIWGLQNIRLNILGSSKCGMEPPILKVNEYLPWVLAQRLTCKYCNKESSKKICKLSSDSV